MSDRKLVDAVEELQQTEELLIQAEKYIEKLEDALEAVLANHRSMRL